MIRLSADGDYIGSCETERAYDRILNAFRIGLHPWLLFAHNRRANGEVLFINASEQLKQRKPCTCFLACLICFSAKDNTTNSQKDQVEYTDYISYIFGNNFYSTHQDARRLLCIISKPADFSKFFLFTAYNVLFYVLQNDMWKNTGSKTIRAKPGLQPGYRMLCNSRVAKEVLRHGRPQRSEYRLSKSNISLTYFATQSRTAADLSV